MQHAIVPLLPAFSALFPKIHLELNADDLNVDLLALAGMGIVCLADFMTGTDRARGDLVQLLARDTVEVRQPVSAVYYRNTALSSRIAAFLDFMAARLR